MIASIFEIQIVNIFEIVVGNRFWNLLNLDLSNICSQFVTFDRRRDYHRRRDYSPGRRL